MTASHMAWLRRVSDYHSGDVSGAERRAVEDHLRTCPECQEALAMYRRLYTLLRSPLRLGASSAHFDQPTVPLAPSPRRDAPATRPIGGGLPGGPPRNRRWVAGTAAVVAAAVVIAGFVAIIGPRLRAPVASDTPTPRASLTPQATAQPSATVAPSVTPTSGPDAFICANPAGSNLVYAYKRGDSNLYIVNGCSAPRQITGSLAPYAYPLAWSPSNRYLAVAGAPDGNSMRVAIVDAQTGALRQTTFLSDFGNANTVGEKVNVFLGWLDDNNFLGGLATIAQTPQGVEEPGATTLVRVSVTTGAQTALGAIKNWANINNTGPNVTARVVANGHYYYYAASDSSGSTGSLHRFDLTTGVDTRLVSLGLFTEGGCQVTPVCAWTTWWDVARDGAHILYHNPGATSAPSDTGAPKDTPVYYANPDGSGAVGIFGSQLAATLVSPEFAPNGQAAAATFTSSPDPTNAQPKAKIARVGGKVTTTSGWFYGWRADSMAMVIMTDSQAPHGPVPELYSVATGATTPLEVNSNWYLWGN